jgi:glycosyltransferase involved in cell wall biosynthesis
MRVLLQIRPDHEGRSGGDSTQARETLTELRACGVAADLSTALAPDLNGYDLVHVFNTQAIGVPLRQVVHARTWGRPVVLSPIYWDLAPFRRATRPASANDDPLVRALERLERGRQAFVVGAAGLLLPNSQAEAEQLRASFPAEFVRATVRVVPNGVDGRFARGNAARFCARNGLEPRAFVLCVGRKEEPKNQLRLIEACGALGLPLVLAGAEPPEFAEYAARCRQAAASSGARVLFLPHLAAEELADAYAAARVHVLPSWHETVGLVSLEAALGGCNVVSTANSGAAEYLGDAAWYCDPRSVDSIREAVANAYAAPLRPQLGAAIAGRYTWRRAAEETLRGYEEVMADHRQRDVAPAPPWLPNLPTEEYVAHLEGLLRLQIEAMAHRDDQYRSLEDYARGVEQAYQVLETNAKEQQQYILRLEAALRATRRRSVGSLLGRLWRRRRRS